MGVNLLHCTKIDRATRARQRREHLLGVARNLFVQRGFHATGIAQIAAASGIKVGQIYRDFASKEDIVAAIVAVDIENFLHEDELARAIADDDRGGVREWVARFLRVDDPIEDCCMMAEILAEMGRNERMAAINRRVEERVRANLSTALAALTPACADDARRARVVELILTLSTGMMCRRVAHPDMDSAALSTLVAQIVDAQIGTVAPSDCQSFAVAPATR